jgi:hypothetical protein
MNASHVATGGITALLATVLVYLSHWPLQPLDLSTASAFAGLLVAAGVGLVKLYKSRCLWRRPRHRALSASPIPQRSCRRILVTA